jgi:hypothetical protein
MSPKRSRKPLDDALAQQFIYGGKLHGTEEELAPEDTSDVSPPEQSSSMNSENVVAQSTANTPSGVTEKPPLKLRLMGKFQTPPKEATIRFTVDLPQSMHRRLSLLAARTGKPKAEIVRMLLDEALEDVKA